MAPITERTVADLEVELRAARSQLANAEHELTTISTRLERFATRYRLILGHRFKVLRTLQAEPLDDADQDLGARTALADSEDPGPTRPSRLPGHADFERLYRDLARRVHPDLAQDPNERKLRTKIMAELNDARGALDFDRARQLRAAWELRSDRIEEHAGGDRYQYLLYAIERSQARLTAVTADITRLQHSNLQLLLNVVEAQERAGIDLLAETAADLDRQIADARTKLAIAPLARRDVIRVQQDVVEVPSEDEHVTVAAAASPSRPTTWIVASLAAMVIIASLGVLVLVLAAAPRDRPVILTSTSAAQDPPARPDPQGTPEPLRYRVVERVPSTSGRTTAIVRIVVDGIPSLAEKASTMADAARREIGAQQVVLVLAYRSISESGGPFTVGRAYLSVDGRGWSGDGSTDDGPDRGGVIGSIVVSIDRTIETQPFSARR